MKLVLSIILLGKDKKSHFERVTDINSRLKNYCQQKHLDFMDNSNILEEHLGNSKLHLLLLSLFLLLLIYLLSTT